MQNNNETQPQNNGTTNKSSEFWGNITILFLPIAVILLLMSRPLIGYLSRETCYLIQGQIPEPSYNPLKWAQLAWHDSITFYKCEWIGYIGFDWTNIIDWLSQISSSTFTSLGMLGGGYASLKGIKTWLSEKNISEIDKDRLKKFVQCIQEIESGKTTNELYFNEALQFSQDTDTHKSHNMDFLIEDDSELSHEHNQYMPSLY